MIIIHMDIEFKVLLCLNGKCFNKKKTKAVVY